jgi:hypothetical protein
MLPCTDLQYPFCPCSPCNLQLQLASPQLLFLSLTLLLTSSEMYMLQVQSNDTKCLSCHASNSMFLLFLYGTFSPFLRFGFFYDSRHSFPVIHDSYREVAPDLT